MIVHRKCREKYILTSIEKQYKDSILFHVKDPSIPTAPPGVPAPHLDDSVVKSILHNLQSPLLCLRLFVEIVDFLVTLQHKI